ncbi:MAG: hypothetical protein K2X27_27230 [Candidatus Obscuribacterales bacterium]|nr:hypothetical protein [Candidatus Obscuribacterales bacterium]
MSNPNRCATCQGKVGVQVPGLCSECSGGTSQKMVKLCPSCRKGRCEVCKQQLPASPSAPTTSQGDSFGAGPTGFGGC